MRKTFIFTMTLAIGLFLFAGVECLAFDEIKVGAILAETGGASFLGGPEARTMRMMVDKINADGGVLGKKINLIIKDSGANPEKAISFTKQLIEEEKVLAILGPSTSGETMKIKKA